MTRYVLAGDVGGTKTRIGLFDAGRRDADHDAPATIEVCGYASPKYLGLASILTDFLERTHAQHGGDIAAAAFGIAGPVLDGRVETPNLPWVVDGAALEAQFGIPTVVLLNDLQANGAGIDALRDDELVTLQAGEPPAGRHAAALISPGTGTGVALLIPVGDRWQVQPSEGGHVELAPRGAADLPLFAALYARFPEHLSVERVLCGPGLVNLYRAVVDSRGALAEPTVAAAIEGAGDDAPRVVAEAALDRRCPACNLALDHFASLLGSVAGNLALTALARGGVYIGGGIAPKILPRLAAGPLLDAFAAKGRFRGLLRTVPLRVILNPDTALLGAAREAARAAGR